MIAALEQQLLQQPDDAATWQVYADALQQRSDPRGDVIALGEGLRAGEKKLAAQFIAKFFKSFPESMETALDRQLDLCEDEDVLVS